MRNLYLSTSLLVFFLAGTWFGYAFLKQHDPNIAIGKLQSEVLANQDDTVDKDGNLLSHHQYQRLDEIEYQLQNINASLNKILVSIGSDSSTSYNTNVKTRIHQVEYSQDEVVEFQNDVLAQLSYSGFDLNKLNTMAKFQNLSEDQKEPVLREIARRLESGEIDKAQFLPGYSK